MPLVKFVDSDGVEAQVQIDAGISVMEGAVKAGIEGIDADCGGQLSCATCHVYLAEDWLDRVPEMTEDEDALLEYAAERRPTSRLCCQIVLRPDLDGLEVHVPAFQAAV
ncbi:MAG: 2Fe-2S iron-sulfur cluster-binding protein [Sphingobium sp.]